MPKPREQRERERAERREKIRNMPPAPRPQPGPPPHVPPERIPSREQLLGMFRGDRITILEPDGTTTEVELT